MSCSAIPISMNRCGSTFVISNDLVERPRSQSRAIHPSVLLRNRSQCCPVPGPVWIPSFCSSSTRASTSASAFLCSSAEMLALWYLNVFSMKLTPFPLHRIRNDGKRLPVGAIETLEDRAQLAHVVAIHPERLPSRRPATFPPAVRPLSGLPPFPWLWNSLRSMITQMFARSWWEVFIAASPHLSFLDLSVAQQVEVELQPVETRRHRHSVCKGQPHAQGPRGCLDAGGFSHVGMTLGRSQAA